MTDHVHRAERAIVISNAASGANRALGVGDVRAAATQTGMRHHCIESIDALPGILRESARSGDTLIVVNAGDGTVSRIIELLRGDDVFSREPALALLRGGTTNMIHNDVGFSGRPADGLRRLAGCLQRGSCRRLARHPLRVRRTAHAGAHYGFFLGTNAALRATLRTRDRLHRHVSTGRLSEVLSIGGMIWRLLRRRVRDDPVLAPVSVSLSREGGPWRDTTQILMLAMSIRRAVLGVRPLERGQRAGLAELNWPDYRLFPWLHRFLRGELEELDSVSLRGEFGWVMDGELHRHGVADGNLVIEVAEPVHFLVDGTGR